jgi:cytochrome P450
LYDISPSRHYQKWKHGRALDRYVGRIVDRRITTGPSAVMADEKAKFYAIDDAIAANQNKGIVNGPTTQVNKETRDMLIASVKTLIFAGHDTSASTLCVSLGASKFHWYAS